jgi:hypothetical protein
VALSDTYENREFLAVSEKVKKMYHKWNEEPTESFLLNEGDRQVSQRIHNEDHPSHSK